MNARLAPIPPPREPLADWPHTAGEHFRLAVLGVVAHILEAATAGDREALFEAHPFLADYAEAIASHLGTPEPSAADWRTALEVWESRAAARLPLPALFRAGLSRLDLELLLAAGLPEEDPRFSELFEQATPRDRRPTAGLLLAWWRSDESGTDRADEVRRAVLGLVRQGLLQVLNPEAPRSEWTLAVAAPLWDALRGEPPCLPWLRYVGWNDLPELADYIAPPAFLDACRRLPDLLTARPGPLLLVRGPRRNGRKTLLGALARALSQGLLMADEAVLDEARWPLFGALATVLDALPVVELSLMAGDNRILPPLPLADGPLAVAAGARGGIHSSDGRAALSLALLLPDAGQRLRHWQAAAPGQLPATLAALAESVRLGSGNLRRAARTALGHARLEGRDGLSLRDAQLACRSLQDARLETLATRLEARGSLDDLALDETTRAELDTLAARCRFREALAASAPDTDLGGYGVRALFAGPSGTGKTLAARLLAATLGKDLFRVDLSATVNKYLGETEKNLDRTFSAAEELDVVLLLDEGDSLLASRTEVGNSNDRYANLETNFLLQRIESFEGILLVTTNAAERIDKAFERRMDVAVQFRAPDEWQRYRILRMHLPEYAGGEPLLQDIAYRCGLTGGQIRNIALHARLLALRNGGAVGERELCAALQREYRKAGAHCPVKRAGRE
jgi:hypothetical protein